MKLFDGKLVATLVNRHNDNEDGRIWWERVDFTIPNHDGIYPLSLYSVNATLDSPRKRRSDLESFVAYYLECWQSPQGGEISTDAANLCRAIWDHEPSILS